MANRRAQRHREIQTLADLEAYLDSGRHLRGLRLQDLDLTAVADRLLARRDLGGLVVLGGRLPPELDAHLRAHRALIFPTDPAAPVDPYRARLYEPRELYAGLDEHGYDATPDALAYRWSQDASLRGDAFVTLLRAIHDDSVSDALTELVADRPVVGVMGGHAVDRGTERYAEAAGLGATLAAQGLVVATGGGPGAMEAANLGAFAGDEDLVAQATERLRAVPSFRPSVDAWASVALDVRDEVARADRAAQVRSIGIPTWFYGHEPPNVFCDGIAKYFSNAIREDGLLTRATAGLVVLEGAAGTVQEIFQAVTPLFYAGDTAVLPPLVLVGRAAWNERVPVWPALQALAGVGEGRRGIPGQDGYGESEGHGLRSSLHLVDTVKEAADVVVSTHRARTGGSRATR